MRIGALLFDVGRILGAYVRGQVIIAALLAAIYGAGFALLDVPAWPLVAVFSGCLHLVPILGALLAMGIPLLLKLYAGGSAYEILGVIGVYVFAQTLESFYLTPKILGRRMSLSPLTVFLAVLLGGMLFGFAGVLLAVPVAAVAALLWRHFSNGRPVTNRPAG
ncbi:MAG: AI-2E family transporter [Bryobacterales bacterium]|nr:AI-2E family transporter [Bryobacterales bacterium]